MDQETKLGIEAEYKIGLTAAQYSRVLEGSSQTGTVKDCGAHCDWYFDDVNGSLRSSGYTLRLRAAGDRWTATLKSGSSPAGVLWRRLEMERQIHAAAALACLHDGGVCLQGMLQDAGVASCRLHVVGYITTIRVTIDDEVEFSLDTSFNATGKMVLQLEAEFSSQEAAKSSRELVASLLSKYDVPWKEAPSKAAALL